MLSSHEHTKSKGAFSDATNYLLCDSPSLLQTEKLVYILRKAATKEDSVLGLSDSKLLRLFKKLLKLTQQASDQDFQHQCFKGFSYLVRVMKRRNLLKNAITEDFCSLLVSKLGSGTKTSRYIWKTAFFAGRYFISRLMPLIRSGQFAKSHIAKLPLETSSSPWTKDEFHTFVEFSILLMQHRDKDNLSTKILFWELVESSWANTIYKLLQGEHSTSEIQQDIVESFLKLWITACKQLSYTKNCIQNQVSLKILLLLWTSRQQVISSNETVMLHVISLFLYLTMNNSVPTEYWEQVLVSFEAQILLLKECDLLEKQPLWRGILDLALALFKLMENVPLEFDVNLLQSRLLITWKEMPVELNWKFAKLFTHFAGSKCWSSVFLFLDEETLSQVIAQAISGPLDDMQAYSVILALCALICQTRNEKLSVIRNILHKFEYNSTVKTAARFELLATIKVVFGIFQSNEEFLVEILNLLGRLYSEQELISEQYLMIFSRISQSLYEVLWHCGLYTVLLDILHSSLYISQLNKETLHMLRVGQKLSVLPVFLSWVKETIAKHNEQYSEVLASNSFSLIGITLSDASGRHTFLELAHSGSLISHSYMHWKKSRNLTLKIIHEIYNTLFNNIEVRWLEKACFCGIFLDMFIPIPQMVEEFQELYQMLYKNALPIIENIPIEVVNHSIAVNITGAEIVCNSTIEKLQSFSKLASQFTFLVDTIVKNYESASICAASVIEYLFALLHKQITAVNQQAGQQLISRSKSMHFATKKRQNGKQIQLEFTNGVKTKPFNAHILAGLSDYFTCLFGSNFSESTQQTISIKYNDNEALVEVLSMAMDIKGRPQFAEVALDKAIQHKASTQTINVTTQVFSWLLSADFFLITAIRMVCEKWLILRRPACTNSQEALALADIIEAYNKVHSINTSLLTSFKYELMQHIRWVVESKEWWMRSEQQRHEILAGAQELELLIAVKIS